MKYAQPDEKYSMISGNYSRGSGLHPHLQFFAADENRT